MRIGLGRAVHAVWLLALVVGLAGGCGEEKPVVKPQSVPEGIAPPRVQNGEYAFFESELPQVKSAFANAGVNSLVADGRLYEMRRADRLVGVLQVSTVLPELDLADTKLRNQVIGQIMPAVRDRITVGDVVVFSSEANNKTVFLWFEKDMFNLLTIKPGSEDQLDAEGVLTEVLDHQTSLPEWDPLYFDDEEI
ncbi:MAG TPA: hypothetical protein VM143_07275 [Acidimicrobiales bacterium]|nr:hypothetical protein [Acidimicrobiales bacterium]